MKFPLIIAARMGSSRLPGKTLMKIEGREMLGMIIDRVKKSNYVGEIILATTELKEDDKLADWAKSEGISFFRGESFDMLKRLSDTVKFVGADSFIEVLGDNPLIDSSIIDATCEEFIKNEYDYVSILTREYSKFCKSNSHIFPIGIRAQVINSKTIFEANRLAQSPINREHATTYIIDHPDKFRIGLIEAENIFSELNYPEYTFAVNVRANLEMIKLIVQVLNKKSQNWNLNDVIKLTSKNQNILSLMGNNASWNN
tara:strand:+ start:1168 stop:1938 length:771 start_codon:yes stop_codon:yes gene_type:complete